jgi:hypothetical protein
MISMAAARPVVPVLNHATVEWNPIACCIVETGVVE